MIAVVLNLHSLLELELHVPVITLRSKWYIMVIRLSGVQFSLNSYEWLTKLDDHEVGAQFVNHEYNYRELDDTKSCDLLIKTITKFKGDFKTRHCFFCQKWQQQAHMTLTVHVFGQDILTVLFHCPISSMMHTHPIRMQFRLHMVLHHKFNQSYFYVLSQMEMMFTRVFQKTTQRR